MPQYGETRRPLANGKTGEDARLMTQDSCLIRSFNLRLKDK
jgi:hypothetical protein